MKPQPKPRAMRGKKKAEHDGRGSCQCDACQEERHARRVNCSSCSGLGCVCCNTNGEKVDDSETIYCLACGKSSQKCKCPRHMSWTPNVVRMFNEAASKALLEAARRVTAPDTAAADKALADFMLAHWKKKYLHHEYQLLAQKHDDLLAACRAARGEAK